MAGTPTFTVSQLLNHHDLTTARRYAHLSDAYRKETATKNYAIAVGWKALHD